MGTMNEMASLRGRSLLTVDDLSDSEMLDVIRLAGELKTEKRRGGHGNRLLHKHIAMVFEKSSTRTRCAASVAARDEGGHAEYLSSHDIHLGKKESAADTARVLGRMFDGILFRGYKQETVELLAEHAGVPVWNGLTDQAHPTQTLADLLTVQEVFGRLAGLKLVYIGDGRNNVVNSLMLGCAKAGVEFVNCTPVELSPREDRVAHAEEVAARTGGSVTVVHDPAAAVVGANAVYTDVWVSMGEEAESARRVELLTPYQVNAALMQQTGNLDSGGVIFLHCLPAFHDHKTEMTRETGAMEVTDDVFEASYSKVFEEAENRMHTIKALYVAALGA